MNETDLIERLLMKSRQLRCGRYVFHSGIEYLVIDSRYRAGMKYLYVDDVVIDPKTGAETIIPHLTMTVVMDTESTLLSFLMAYQENAFCREYLAAKLGVSTVVQIPAVTVCGKPSSSQTP